MIESSCGLSQSADVEQEVYAWRASYIRLEFSLEWRYSEENNCSKKYIMDNGHTFQLHLTTD